MSVDGARTRKGRRLQRADLSATPSGELAGGGLLLGPQALRADADLAEAPADLKRGRLEIGVEDAVGAALGVAHVVAVTGALAAQFAFSCQIPIPPFNWVLQFAIIGRAARPRHCDAGPGAGTTVAYHAALSAGKMEIRNPTGKIVISNQAIASLVSRTVSEGYGVVGLAARHLRDGIAEVLHRDVRNKGVDVRVVNGRITIELYVVVEYGTRISEVARNLAGNVKFAVERAVGVPVDHVNVNVQGLRVSDPT
jgi:uncharacterized alkaline shock family protein YloU